MFCIDNLSGDELSISFYTGIVMTRMNLVIQYLGFQLFREPETVSSASDVMSLLTVNDSSTRRLLFFDENLADGGSLFRGEVRHASFEGTAVMHVYTHLPSSKAFSDFAFTKMQWANVCNFPQFEFRSDVSSNLLQPLSSKVWPWIFRKIQEADSLSVGVYGSSLVVKRNTAIIFQLELAFRWAIIST